MKEAVKDIETVMQVVLTRRREKILLDAGVSPDLVDAELYRLVRETKKEVRSLNKDIVSLNKDIASLEESIKSKDEQIDKHLQRISELEEQVKQLNTKLGKLDRPVTTSMNSNLPPSKNPIGIKHTTSLREKSGKPNGGQPGHEGHTRYRDAVPGKIEVCAPKFCPCCGEPITEDMLHEKEVRQVVDLPSPIIPIITDYVQMGATCKCGKKVLGKFPAEAKAAVCYGPNVEAAVAYLDTIHAVPFKRITEIMEYLFGIHMSQGTVSNILRDMRKKSKYGCEAIRRGIEIGTGVTGADETGLKVNGEGMWMWVFQTDLLTYMFVDTGRAKEIIDKHFPDGLKSILVTDRLSSYFNVDVKAHQDCLVHILRNTFYFTLLLSDEAWPVDFMDFLRESIHEKNENGASAELFERQNAKLKELLERELICKNSEDEEKYKKLATFQKQMVKHKDNLLTFLKYQSVPADNNSSERALRNVKTKMKVSGQFKTTEGAQTYANLHSISQTALKNGQNPYLTLLAVARYQPEK